MTSFVLLVEYSGVKHRSSAAKTWYYDCMMVMAMTLVAYLAREWRHLMLYAAIMSVPVVVATRYVSFLVLKFYSCSYRCSYIGKTFDWNLIYQHIFINLRGIAA